MKKMILFLTAVVFLSGAHLVFAGVIISEVKISPTEDRFIKLYNQGSEGVDLTNWYIQRKTATGSSFDSLVTKTNFENKKIDGNSYFLISRSQMQGSDIVLGTLTLTESNVIQIKDGSGEVVDKVCWGDVNDCGTSLPNPTSGQSIQFTDHTSASTPSTSASATGSLISTNSDNNPLISTMTATTTTKNKTTEEPKIRTQIIGKTIGFAGISLSLNAKALGYSGELLHFGKYFWNFGDGDSREINMVDSQPFTHTYFYPGEYTITLDYYGSNYQELPDTSNQMMIKIIPADIFISKVGDEKDFFVELTNNTDYPADLSNWILMSDAKSFTIPRNTILASKSKIIISPKITGFLIADQDTLKLMTPEREVVFDYGGTNSPLEEYPKALPRGEVDNASTPSPIKVGDTPQEGNNSEIPINNLTASSVSSGVIPEKSSLPVIPIFSTIFIGAAAYGVYFIRQKKVVPEVGNSEFEILDE